jgi:hypothetical protein
MLTFQITPPMSVLLLLLRAACCCSNEALHIPDHELQMFLRTLHKQLETVALHPTPAYMVRWQQQQGSSKAAAAAGQCL